MPMNGYRLKAWYLTLALCLLVAATAFGQDLRSSLFAEADELIAQGQVERADVLAPKSWGKGMEAFNSAERKLAAGKNLDDIRKDLNQAVASFQQAIEATDLAMVTLASTLKARDDAAKVNAAGSAPDLWNQGEAKFAEAGRKLEEGNVNDARKKGAEAETYYRDAELSAIKTSFFDETRTLLARANKEKVDKVAPITLELATNLLAEAEAALNEDRYDIDRPRTLAIEAKYEALHALHLAKVIRMIDDKQMTEEQLILQAEKPLTSIAGTLDLNVGFAEGFAKPTQTIVEAINLLEAEQDQLASDLVDREARIESLNEQVAQLETNLGGASEAQAALQAQIAAQESAQRSFTQVEQMFTREEARVLREGGNVVVRLVGMNFASGQSEIRPDNFSLLTKVKAAIALYPGSMVTIEGYTDAYGSDESNLKLSQERADAVAQYLLANSNLPASNLTAVGFGEMNPIANNETPEGRKKNRRIDIVITPAK